MFLMLIQKQPSISLKSVCPASRGETIEQACMVHGTDADALLAKLQAATK